MRSHTLSLRRETLAPLSVEDMTAVVGGSHTCPLTDRCGDTITHGPSFDATCPSAPVTGCTGTQSQSPVSRNVCL